MITRAHIFTLIIIAALYAAVAVWKLDSSSDLQNSEIFRQTAEDYSSEAVFWTHYNQANDFRSRGDYQKAADEYLHALNVNAHHKDALYYSGNMHLLLKEYRKTKIYLDRLLQEEPNAPRTHLQLGSLYFCMDKDNEFLDLDKADEYISHAWQLNREETGAPLLLSKIALLKKDFLKSKRILDDILATDRSSIEALFLAGYIHWQNNNQEEAQKFHAGAEREYQMQDQKIIQGEGNTESGARAMLAEDRYCDKFEDTIELLISNTDMSDTTFKEFSSRLRGWRKEFQIE